MTEPLLAVRDLHTYFKKRRPGGLGRTAWVKAVNGVSFELQAGEVLGLCGESGCGKTTVGRSLTRLDRPTAGSVLFEGENILTLPEKRFRALRRNIQMVFQDPYASLNPRLTIERTLREPLAIHGLAASRIDARRQIISVLEQVGLSESALNRFPHEFSGGQRQRIGIARVMILKPKLVIADEAVSALDVSIQAQVLNLIKQLQRDNAIALLFISHDLAVVRHISDRVAVMKDGRIVEIADKHTLFTNPTHDYTKQLLQSVPRVPVRPVVT